MPLHFLFLASRPNGMPKDTTHLSIVSENQIDFTTDAEKLKSGSYFPSDFFAESAPARTVAVVRDGGKVTIQQYRFLSLALE